MSLVLLFRHRHSVYSHSLTDNRSGASGLPEEKKIIQKILTEEVKTVKKLSKRQKAKILKEYAINPLFEIEWQKIDVSDLKELKKKILRSGKKLIAELDELTYEPLVEPELQKEVVTYEEPKKEKIEKEGPPVNINKHLKLLETIEMLEQVDKKRTPAITFVNTDLYLIETISQKRRQEKQKRAEYVKLLVDLQEILDDLEVLKMLK